MLEGNRENLLGLKMSEKTLEFLEKFCRITYCYVSFEVIDEKVILYFNNVSNNMCLFDLVFDIKGEGYSASKTAFLYMTFLENFIESYLNDIYIEYLKRN